MQNLSAGYIQSFVDRITNEIKNNGLTFETLLSRYKTSGTVENDAEIIEIGSGDNSLKITPIEEGMQLTYVMDGQSRTDDVHPLFG